MSSVEKQLELFTDALVENIIDTPDAEILKEVKEDYGSEDFLATKLKKIFEEAALRNGVKL